MSLVDPSQLFLFEHVLQFEDPSQSDVLLHPLFDSHPEVTLGPPDSEAALTRSVILRSVNNGRPLESIETPFPEINPLTKFSMCKFPVSS